MAWRICSTTINVWLTLPNVRLCDHLSWTQVKEWDGDEMLYGWVFSDETGMVRQILCPTCGRLKRKELTG